MQLVDRRIEPSPDGSDTLRITATLRMERSNAAHTVWFEVPQAYGDGLSQSANSWLVLLVPIAMDHGEDIEIPYPVDSLLVENLRGLMRQWQAWYPELRPAEIDAPRESPGTPPAGTPPARRRGLFFSGGMDSFFSLLRHDTDASGCAAGPVDDLIFVAGLDIPLLATQELESARTRIGEIAERHGKGLIWVSTNLKSVGPVFRERWILSHGCALAAVGHLLDRHFGEIVIASTHSYGHLLPIGSHPMTDPLLGSRHLRFVHDGAAFSRVDKAARIAASPGDLGSLRVCWQAKRHDNCSKCGKCLFSMAALDLANLAGKAACFDWSGYRPELIADLLLDSESEMNHVSDIAKAARAAGRSDLADAAQKCLDKSLRVRRAVNFTNHLPFLWRFDYQVRELLRHHS